MPAHRNCFTFMRVCPPYLGSKSLFQCTPFPQRIQPEVLRAALRFRFGGVFGVVLHQPAAKFQGVFSPSPPAAGRGPRFISFRWAEVNPAQLRRTRGAGCRRQGESAPRSIPLSQPGRSWRSPPPACARISGRPQPQPARSGPRAPFHFISLGGSESRPAPPHTRRRLPPAGGVHPRSIPLSEPGRSWRSPPPACGRISGRPPPF